MERIPHRKEKMESLLTRVVGEFVSHEAGPMSLITVTRVVHNAKAKRATVFITVLPDSKEKAALEFLQRKSSGLREYARDHAKIGILPVFEFTLDIGEKNRQRVDDIAASEHPESVDL